MKQELFLILSIASLLLAGYNISNYKSNEQQQSLQQMYQGKFEHWKQEYHREYSNQSEEIYRFAIFMDNENFIDHWNLEHSDVKLKENNFVDLTDDEFQQTHMGLIQQDNDQQDIISNLKKSDQYFDGKLRQEKNEIQEVDYSYLNTLGIKEQKCGDCYANCAAKVTELAFFKDKEVSRQDIVDCDQSNNGCTGGDQGRAMMRLQREGVVFEDEYQYQGEVQSCQNSAERKQLGNDVKVDKHANFSAESSYCKYIRETMVEHGPVGVSLQVEQSLWRFYSEGILDHDLNAPWRYKDETALRFTVNHAVTLVGFTQDYWLIMNSWGEKWGDKGYMKIKMGDYFNICHEIAWYESENLRFKTEQQDQ